MPEQLIIEGDLVKVVQTELIRQVRLADVMPHIESRPPLTIGLLPKTAVMFHWDESNPKEKKAAFLCEVPPALRVARYERKRYTISVPWTYFVFDFETDGNPADASTIWRHQNSRIFWAREQVTGMKSELRTALVPNCDTRHGICYGTTGVPVTLPLGIRVDRLVGEFWHTTFTHDSGTGSPWTDETGDTSWKRWSTESLRDPNAWQKFPEWTNGTSRMKKVTVEKALGEKWSRFEPVQMDGTIPDLIEPLTFGRAEEWLLGVSPVSRHRLMVALQNMHADDPVAIEAPAENATITNVEDPGTLIPDEEL